MSVQMVGRQVYLIDLDKWNYNGIIIHNETNEFTIEETHLVMGGGNTYLYKLVNNKNDLSIWAYRKEFVLEKAKSKPIRKGYVGINLDSEATPSGLEVVSIKDTKEEVERDIIDYFKDGSETGVNFIICKVESVLNLTTQSSVKVERLF